MMSQTDLPNDKNWPWSFEIREDTVGMYYIDGWNGYDEDTLDAISEHYRKRTNRPDITATVAVFSEDTSLPAETQEYISQEWGDNAKGVARAAFVSSSTKAIAVNANVDIEGNTETEWFKDVEEAVEWAAEA